MLTPQWLDQLRARTTLSALIGRSVRLQKAGREHRACCPFHNENSPSFYVNDEKGFYHCFGCGAHGDAIRWMTDHQGLAFMDAVKELAGEAGMDVPAPDPRAAKAAEKRDSLHDVMAAAQAFFEESLKAAEGEKARQYLATRGFNAHTVERFGFGFAPEGRQALKSALSRFPEPMLIEAGLRIAVEERDPYDRFRDRLMLPIADARGRVIAFGGRILAKGKTDAPKYLNSPDTPLFDKGRTLYNLHRAAPAARQTGRMVVVEGYMDVIALAAAGIADAVAPLGTALTEHQIEMLWRHVEMPILCFDGDAAGQRAAMRAITRALPLLRPAHSLRIVRLPEGLDPDDLIKARGPAAMETILGESRSLLDVLWEHERDALPLETPEAKAGLKTRLLAHVETIAHQDIAGLYRRELLDRFSEFAYPRRENRWQNGGQNGGFQNGGANRAPFQPGRKGPWNGRQNGPAPSSPESIARLAARFGGGDREALAAAVLVGLIHWPEVLARYAEPISRTPDLDARFDLLLECWDEHGPLESADFATILAANGMEIPSAQERVGIRWSFVSSDNDAERAQKDLTQAIELLTDMPLVEKALAEATERCTRDLTEETYAEQQRLRMRSDAMRAKLKALKAGI